LIQESPVPFTSNCCAALEIIIEINMNQSPILRKTSSEFKGIKCSPHEITTNSYTIAIGKNISKHED